MTRVGTVEKPKQSQGIGYNCIKYQARQREYQDEYVTIFDG